jgi:hypothetical protein
MFCLNASLRQKIAFYTFVAFNLLVDDTHRPVSINPHVMELCHVPQIDVDVWVHCLAKGHSLSYTFDPICRHRTLRAP